jgi:D-serine deaminase-like pyridoxal phosphate-dependent protein
MTTTRRPLVQVFDLLPEARAAIETPALVVDLARMDAAIERMAVLMGDRGVALRPHAKTHKSVEVGHRQLDAGATGLTVGTLGEAEVFAAGGARDLFIAYPLLPVGAKADRLRWLAAGDIALSIGIDSVAGARAIAAALGADTGRVRILVEIDSGGRRTGIAPDDAGPLAAEAVSLGLDVVGVFTHGGHGYADPSAGAGAADDEVTSLAQAADALRRVGIEPQVVSAGSTPTAVGSARGVVTEERPGTYVFGDRLQVGLGSIAPDAVAAMVAATVVSVMAGERRFVVDAGAKILGKDVAPYVAGHGELPELGGAVVSRVYDYHGVVELPGAPSANPASASDGDAPMPAVGDVVLVVPNHICPVVNLVNTFQVVQGGRIVDEWVVDARGRNG